MKQVADFNLQLAIKNHNLACSQNSYVLKFLIPNGTHQRVSYIRTPEGGYQNVQIKVTGTRVEANHNINRSIYVSIVLLNISLIHQFRPKIVLS